MASIPSRIYLISKWGDVALGLSTGVFAYYLYEKKSFRTERDSLRGLINWKLDQLRTNRGKEAVLREEEEGGWEELTRELSSTSGRNLETK